ncbi:YcjF family protein [Limisalsivibrio acetivorans]|uniref:YcjF family protein n=1 Tax=Limisalsivibrio acetivorans TaxID=1304888 RepID=UPI000424E59B|nr:YcjF family protein [Limisalsivibrio acetivorans]
METAEKTVFETLSFEERKEKADETVKKHVYAAMGVGLVPIPVVDFVGVTGVQIDMLNKLAKFYGIPFKKDRVKNILSSLVGGLIPAGLGLPVASLLKAVPVVGTTVGALGMPIVAGASTYAVGRVFVQHFESGGTFLSFDPGSVREHFEEEFKTGQKVARAAADKK